MTTFRKSKIKCDILVAGGGISGVSCALAASRCGARVVLCQDRPVLGGNASSEVRMHIVGANGMKEGIPLVTEAREGGIIEEIRLEQCVRNPQRSPSMMDLCLYDLCRREANLTLLLNCSVTEASSTDSEITSVTAIRTSTRESFKITAKVFVDSTGDSALAYAVGAQLMTGREGKDVFGESLAPEKSDSMTLGSTLLYQARQHKQEMPFNPPPWARRVEQDDLRLRPFGQPGMDLNLEYGFWWLEWGGHLDTVSDNEKIRDELLAILMGVWDFIKNRSDLDTSQWALDWCGFVPGKRESHRIRGQHVLTEHDLLQSKIFEDAIATGGWPIDIHPPMGIDAPDEPPSALNDLPSLYDIPVSSCLSAEFDNLLFAGRNISASHLAFASTRVMATCSAIGQGVGTSAAYAVSSGISPGSLPKDGPAMRAIQQQLIRDGAMLLRVRNEDSRDLAKSAKITASSEQEEGKATLITDGWTRSLHRDNDHLGPHPITAPPGIAPDSTHRWMSKTDDSEYLELRWQDVQSIQKIELTFDTGLHRLLTLSMADGYTARMIWGRPQPETVRRLDLKALVSDQWQCIASMEDNYQRQRILQLDSPVTTSALRIYFQQTNGLNHFRLIEARVYSPSSCGPFLQ